MYQKIKGRFKRFIIPVIKVFKTVYSLKYYRNSKEFYSNLKNKLEYNHYDAVVIYDSYFGFNSPMFQRPQHIAINLSKLNILYLYKASPTGDRDVKIYKEINDNLYVVDFDIYWIKRMIFNLLNKVNTKKFVQVYSTSFMDFDKYLKKYKENGFKILYEYVDEFSEKISRYKISPRVKKSHKNMLSDSDNVYVIVTADKLYKEAAQYRERRLKLVTNGVQYEHFSNLDNIKIPSQVRLVRDNGRKIIGYFGALASWFDYELIKKIACEYVDCQIMLIGVNYDNSLTKSGILEFDNITYLGIINYKDLPNYAKYFDVAIVPFIINEITESTSPVKLFEYMALELPIVTTKLPECKKYKSTLVSESHEDFINNISKALKLKENSDYIKLLREEALSNTWTQKAKDIKELILNN